MSTFVTTASVYVDGCNSAEDAVAKIEALNTACREYDVPFRMQVVLPHEPNWSSYDEEEISDA